MQGGVKNAARKLKTEGVEAEIQTILNINCPTPHIHPRWKRNSE